ncbi:MAG: YceI family protein [Rhodothermales bacterium]
MNQTDTQQLVRTYDVDASHSTVEFKVRHLGFSKVTGRFTKFDASVEMEPGDLSTLQVEASVDVRSIETGDAKRDEHLRSEDFFAGETHPTMQFTSTGVTRVSGNEFTLAGDLTIRGTTRPVEIHGTYLGQATDPWGASRIAIEGTTRINREDFGLTWNQTLETGGLLVSKEVEIALEVQGVQRSED